MDRLCVRREERECARAEGGGAARGERRVPGGLMQSQTERGRRLECADELRLRDRELSGPAQDRFLGERGERA